ncbi:aminopeptidase C [Lacticigenium naphthae]|uniref:aminopeptidase C n=1 Tax=Lacticigenium naphthae TaxID=515351 RepID=UPI00040682B8|nr:C1 family peptidase [Lacticigenium naphthae]
MIDTALLEKFNNQLTSDPASQAVKNAIAKVGINEASFNNSVMRKHTFAFSQETKKGEMTNQKASGRCWMFAALNTARIDTMKKLDAEDFEFSQNYTLFWDKLEKSNYFLDSILETATEPLDSRLVQHLLTDPIQDGGQWDMFAGLLNKYGAVPKSVMPETYHSSNTKVLNTLMTSKLREFAARLRELKENGSSNEEIAMEKERMLSWIYATLVKTLGEVPTTFTYAYHDTKGNYQAISEITPQNFFAEYVDWNLEKRISLIHAPTKDKPFGRAYTVKYLGTVKEAQPVRYINTPIKALKDAAIASIKNGEPVWFGCDVGKMSERKAGVMDTETYSYDLTLNEPIRLTKAQRLDYGDSLLTHAMVLVGVDLDENDQPINWKVENSWGEKVGKKGIFSMSDQWFDEYTYQVAVDTKYIEEKWLKALAEPIIELEPWDPMGALAKVL